MSIIATARPDGTGTVTLPSSGEQTVTADTLDDARDELLDLIAAEAATVGHPLRVEAHDPDAIYHVVVHPDGQIEPEQPQAGTTASPPQASGGDRSQPYVVPSHRRRRVIAGIAIAALGLGSLGGLAVALSRPAPEPVTAAADADAPPAAPQPEPPTPANSGAVSWHGTALPIDTTAGPTTWTATRSSGFQHSELGAALAAVHISTHMDPYTGPDVFTPTINQQVIGDTDTLLDTYTAVYSQEAKKLHVTGGKALPAATGRFVSWTIPDYNPDGTNPVHLLVEAQNQLIEFVVPVRWVDGDWKAAPDIDASGAHFQTSQTPANSNSNTPFNTNTQGK